MVGPEDVDEELQRDIEEECAKYGKVVQVIIYQVIFPTPSPSPLSLSCSLFSVYPVSLSSALWNRNRRNRDFLTSGTGTVTVAC
jgi:hypothetical protein